jgi:hypothetical protein
MRNLLYFLGSFFLAVLFGIASAYAETIPATSSTVDKYGITLPLCGGGTTFTGYNYTTKEQVAAALDAHYPVTCGSDTYDAQNVHVSGSNICYDNIANGQNWGQDCRTIQVLAGQTEYSCPANQGWTLEGQSCTRPDCPSGNRDAQGNCIGQCDGKGNQDAVEGYYVSPPPLICKSGCVAKRYLVIDGAPGYGVLINGKEQLYAKYLYTYEPLVSNTANGIACSDVSQSLADSTPPEPVTNPENITQSCAAGQQGGTVNGKYVCFDQSTGVPVAESGPAQKEKTETTSVTNPDGSVTETTTTTYPDGSKKIVKKTTQPSGQSDSETTEIGSDGKPIVSGGLGSSGSPNGSQDSQKQAVKEGVKEGLTDYCQANPTTEMCKQASEDEEIDSGTAANITGIYEKQSGDKTFESVLVSFKNNVSGLPFFTAATNAFSLSIPAGSCSGLSASIPIDILDFHTVWNIDLTETFCGTTALYVYFIFGIGLLITATWVGIRIALL